MNFYEPFLPFYDITSCKDADIILPRGGIVIQCVDKTLNV